MRVFAAALVALSSFSTIRLATNAGPLSLSHHELQPKSCLGIEGGESIERRLSSSLPGGFPLPLNRREVELLPEEIARRAPAFAAPKGLKGSGEDPFVSPVGAGGAGGAAGGGGSGGFGNNGPVTGGGRGSEPAAPVGGAGGRAGDGDDSGGVVNNGPVTGDRGGSEPAAQPGGAGNNGPVTGNLPPPSILGPAPKDSPFQSTNPGVQSSRFDDGTAEAVRGNGAKTQQQLDEAIGNNLADVDKGDILSKGYFRDVSTETARGPLDGDSISPTRVQYLEDIGIDATMKNAKQWSSFQIGNERNTLMPILEYSVSTSEKAIIKAAYNKENDANRSPESPNSANAMQLRDMMMDNWRVAAGANKVRELKWVVRDNVVTKESTIAIDKSFEMAGATVPSKLELKPTSTDPNLLAAYQEIAGTAHGQGILKCFLITTASLII